MTVFTQNSNQTAGLNGRLNGRPSFMITDILAANNTTISPAAAAAAAAPPAPAGVAGSATSPPSPSPSETAAASSLYQHYHQHQQFLQHQHYQQQQHQHHMQLMQAAKLLPHPGHPGHAAGHPPMMMPAGMGLPPAMLAAAGAGGDVGGEMRVPTAGLSPLASEPEFEGSEEDAEEDGEDGDSSVCSNGTGKDTDTDANDSGRSGTNNNLHHHSGNPLLSGMRPSSKKQRKARTAFSDHQLHSLEKSFTRQKYLSVQDRMELAVKLGISDTQVKTWFQNRRTKWKRQTSVGFELLVEAGNFAAYQRAAAFRTGYPDPSAYMPHGYPGLGAGPQGIPSATELYYRHHQQQQQQQQQQQFTQQQHAQHMQHPAYSMYAVAAAAAAAAMNSGGGAAAAGGAGLSKPSAPMPLQHQPQPTGFPGYPNANSAPPLARPTAQMPLMPLMPPHLLAAAPLVRQTSISPVGSLPSDAEEVVATPAGRSSPVLNLAANLRATTTAAATTSEADDDDESDIEV